MADQAGIEEGTGPQRFVLRSDSLSPLDSIGEDPDLYIRIVSRLVMNQMWDLLVNGYDVNRPDARLVCEGVEEIILGPLGSEAIAATTPPNSKANAIVALVQGVITRHLPGYASLREEIVRDLGNPEAPTREAVRNTIRLVLIDGYL